MSTVETLSPRSIRARSIAKDLSGETLRELARAGEKTTEYGSPVYSTRVKNRSAKNTYIVKRGDRIRLLTPGGGGYGTPINANLSSTAASSSPIETRFLTLPPP